MRYRSHIYDLAAIRNSKKVSFCTTLTSVNEASLETLSRNLKANWSDRAQVEFVVLAEKESFTTIQARFSEELDRGLLKVASYPSTPAVSKNILIQLASGQVVFFHAFTDYLAARVGTFIFEEMSKSPLESFMILEKKLHQVERLAIWRDTIYEVGGFNEQIQVRKQGTEMVDRLTKIGCVKTYYSHFNLTDGSAKRPWQLSLISSKSLKASMTPLVASQLQWLK